jgi:hypothetical protein
MSTQQQQPQRNYEGKRTDNGVQVTVTTVPGAGSMAAEASGDAALLTQQDLPLRLDLWNHSPAGFEWGYGGSGPAQLALALLADALQDDEKAVALHQSFKWAVVGSLPHVSWTLKDEEVRAIAARVEAEQAVRQAGQKSSRSSSDDETA